MNKDYSKMRFIFWGTGRFAEIILADMIKNGLKPALVVTAPDKKTGRKQILTASLVKQLALVNHINVLQPVNLNANQEIVEEIRRNKIEFGLVADYGSLIPKAIIDLPDKKTLNIHPSLLPKYRGASPIQQVILNSDQETGVSVIVLDDKLDHGPLLAQRKIHLSGQETFNYLLESLAHNGCEIFFSSVFDYLDGKLIAIPQNDTFASYCREIKKDEGFIKFMQPAEVIARMLRAFSPWPGVFFKSKELNKEVKILSGSEFKTKLKQKIEIGKIVIFNKQLLLTCAHQTFFQINQVIVSGKKEMSSQEFINGYGKYLDLI